MRDGATLMAGQNTSHAVMAQRFEPADSLDYFPTPPWATRALCEFIEPHSLSSVWEPACGAGHMAKVFDEYFGLMYASDLSYYGYGDGGLDFLTCEPIKDVDWVITNPPFNLAEQFAARGLQIASQGVALLVRTSFLEGVGRFERLFSQTPPSDVLQFTERVPMHKGKLVKGGSTATAYCWLVWRKSANDWTKFRWIAPCRKRLERDEDYR